MTASEFTARLVGPAARIGRANWNACANPENAALPNPFTRYEFFEAAEESGSATAKTGWRPLHLVVERDGAIDGILPLYLKSHSQGEYVFDHAWADALERAGGDYYPKLQASVPFTPVTGRRFLVRNPAAQAALIAAGPAAVAQLEASSLHVTFLTEAEWGAAGEAGYLLRTDQQFHWHNRGYKTFDDFLAALSSSKRKNLRKEREGVRAAGVAFDWLSGSDLTEAHWDQFFEFYMDTGGRKWGHPYLTRDFFSRIGASMANQVLLVMARRDGRTIAGALNFMDAGTLYGRNWGCTEFVPFLHFETCYYQAVEFAIAKGLKKVEAGAQGAHKLLRGYLPVPTYSAHYISHPGLRRAVDDYLKREREAVAAQIEDLAEHGPFRKPG
ncbi:MAG: N-acetyltransferase [Alphaproteobacteria bacterium]|nr:N-acetyltransferase [Alphaproteobacteria bacterium]MBV9692243.1 N-acetyltransferase [Alphaproteobacteria bacterium]